MRQFPVVLLCLSAARLWAQTPAAALEDTANKRIELAQKDLTRLKELVEMGAVARLQVVRAEQNLADAQDDAVLARTLYGDLSAKDWNDQAATDMVAAAERRVERQQERLAQAQKLVDQGFEAQYMLEPVREELSARQLKLDMARSRVQQMSNLAALAKLEEAIAQTQEAARGDNRDLVIDGMEHFDGSRDFREVRDLKTIQAAFAREFDRDLPISADGETSLHRALGFDHRGRVDVAVDPNAREGIWLRGYLKARNIPYYAFTHAVPGKATAAHIHIGPGSTRLSNAD